MRKLSYFHWFIIILLFTACGAEHNMKKGEQYLAIGEYFDAANQFKQAYQRTPVKEKSLRGQRALKMARCYDRLNDVQRAVAAYRNVNRLIGLTTDDRLQYARLLLRTGNYNEARKEFQQVLDSMPSSQLAKNGLASAQNASEWKNQPSRYTVKKAEQFNSRRADFSPMLFGDLSDQLYFTSTRNEATGDELSGITGTKPADIFYSVKDDKGKWSKPEPAGGQLNTVEEEGTPCFSPDGRMMYLTQCLTDPNYPRYGQIATSNRSDASWSKAEPLKISRDTLSSFAHPAISPDGQWLYFTSDMPGGKGGLDIWRVRITTNGLGGVENLGSPINTEGNECFPTFRNNGDFYFSSDGHPGLGGLDLFCLEIPRAKRGKNQPAARPVFKHLPAPMNSAGDDFGMTFEGQLNQGFFSSNRNDGRGWDHIYSFLCPEVVQTVKGWVYEMEGYELPAAQVYIVGNDGTNQKLNVLSDGSFTYKIEPDVEYALMATCRGFLNHKEELRVQPVEESKEYVLQFPLASLVAPVLIDNIFYDFDKATLRPESTQALDELVKLLNENPNVTIELRAHCDYKGSQQYNRALSQRRAEAVVAYLVAHGIARDRLSPVGYGKDLPKVLRKKMAAQYEWAKEGDTLTEEYILKLTPEQQEICNQLNRRTEFLVLSTTYGMFDENGQLIKEPTPKPRQQQRADDEWDIVIE